jgi:hypothetical protein
MIEVLPLFGKYKYDTWRILPVKCYIDNFVRLQSCIRNINNCPRSFRVEAKLLLLLWAEVNALVYFSIFALTRVFSTLVGSPKNFMCRCPTRWCTAKRACAWYHFPVSHGNTPCPCKEYYHTWLPNDIARSSTRSWGAAPFLWCVAHCSLAIWY